MTFDISAARDMDRGEPRTAECASALAQDGEDAGEPSACTLTRDPLDDYVARGARA